MIKVAVVTRTKDRPLFLKRAIESVSAQSYDQYVHVIVNDGGNTAVVEQVIASFPERVQSKIQLFHRDTSSEAPDTIFTESIDRVDSQYFTLHDDDDTWHPEFLSHTVSYLDGHPHLGAVVVRTDKIDESLEGESIRTNRVTRWMPDLKVVNLYRQCIDNQLTPISTLFSRRAYKEVGKFDSTLPVVGDWEFGVRLLMSYDVDIIDPGFALAYYHHRRFQKATQGNTSFAGNDKHRYYTNLVMNRYLREELKDGRLGVGYIMSSIKYNQSYTAGLFKRILPSGVVDRIKKRVQN